MYRNKRSKKKGKRYRGCKSHLEWHKQSRNYIIFDLLHFYFKNNIKSEKILKLKIGNFLILLLIKDYKR